MNMAQVFNDNYDKANSIITLVFTIIGVISIVYGVRKAVWELNIRSATNHLGPVCIEREDMGVFVAQTPGRCREFLWPCCFGRVPKPRLPTVTALLKAGDEGRFTSAMFEWIPNNRRHVTWRPLYEAFFEEILWAHWCPSNGSFAKPNLNEFDKSSRKYIENILEDAAQNLREKNYISQSHMKRFYQFLIGRFRRTTGHEIVVKQCKIPLIDRHLLYYPWKLEIKRKDSEKTYHKHIGPILASSHMRLKDVQVARMPRINEEAWTRDFANIRVHAGKPCIEISDEEISALAFALGVELFAEDHYLPRGLGPYGILLSSESDDCFEKLRITYRRHKETELIAGSGYSILYAKYMACGCLPFAVINDYNEVQAILLSDSIIQSIKTGQGIHDRCENPTIHSRNEDTHLRRLPGSASMNLYCDPYTGGHGLNAKKSSGPLQIENTSLYTWVRTKPSGPLTPMCVGNWSEAVTRIAFGGLVPVATRPLIDAVKFTLGTDICPITESEIRHFNKLINKVLDLTEKSVGRGVPLFGGTQRWIRRNMSEERPIDFSRWCSNKHRLRTREIAGQLGLYTTLLESLIALTQNSPILLRGNIAQDRLKLIFDICVTKVKRCYSESIEKEQIGYNNHYSQSRVEISKIFEGAIKELDGTGFCSFETCASVALCCIMTWTSIVKEVSWADTGDGESTGQLKENGSINSPGLVVALVEHDNHEGNNENHQRKESGVYTAVPLKQLPDIALWE
ncbi:hypothetical protein N5P37_005659 [Trichoderma harzianum]|nr:hypothetical protein N5P37_005659 [Trichoderma harzianum]